jgi:hypothetical protein
VHASQDCDCCIVPYQRGEGYYGESTRPFQSQRPLCIHYNRGLSNAKNEALVNNSFDLSESSSSSAERYREQPEVDNYDSNMPRKPVHYMSDEHTSSDFGNGFKHLVWD